MFKKILLIEDDDCLRRSLLTALTVEGFMAIEAKDGSMGVYLARTQEPDLILCDLMMPDLDGTTVLKILRQDVQTHSIPFICLTADETAIARKELLQLGADGYLQKPFCREALFSAIREQLWGLNSVVLSA